MLAFAQPPYRNRYDRTTTRIHGFFVDYLGVTGKPRHENTERGGKAPDTVAAGVVQDWRSLVSWSGQWCRDSLRSPNVARAPPSS